MSVSMRDEVHGANFGDGRLDERLQTIAEEFASSPNLSIPAATTTRAEMEAAYRFFNNDKVTPEKILEPHFQATRNRIAEQDTALLIQDTTELDLTRPEKQVRGAGPMDCDTRRGAFLHPMLAFDLQALPLGMVWQKSWAREELQSELTAAEKKKKRNTTPIEDKESLRWIEGLRAARAVAEACPSTDCICVGDSEADIYELFSEADAAPEENLHLLVRACQTRATTDHSNWLAQARATACLATCSVDVSARRAKQMAAAQQGKRKQPREARLAEVEIRATTVTLRPPYRHDRKLPEVTIQVVLVEEVEPPTGCEPILWLLVTTLAIDTIEQVQAVVSGYCVRWQIEIFFKTIKTGCRVERRQFETIDRMLNCLAVYSIVAWRIMYLCRLGRECPDLDCEVVFEPCEWKAVYMAIKRTAPPRTPPRLNEMIRLIASLGGYVIRKSTQPGPQTLWIGLQRVHDMSTAWEAFGPES